MADKTKYDASISDRAGAILQGRKDLHALSQVVSERICRWLEESKLDPNSKNSETHFMPLLYCAVVGRWDNVVAALLKHGADPYIPIPYLGAKPTSYTGTLSMLTYLVFHGASTESNANALKHLLVIASKQGMPIDINRPDSGGKSPLAVAVNSALDKRNLAPFVHLLSRWGANPNVQLMPNHQGSLLEQALDHALRNEGAENSGASFKELLYCGADLHARSTRHPAMTLAQWVKENPGSAPWQEVHSIRQRWQNRLLIQPKLRAVDWLEIREDGVEIVKQELRAAIGVGVPGILNPARWENSLESIPRLLAALPPHCQRYASVITALAMVDGSRIDTPLADWSERLRSPGQPRQIN